MKVERVEKIQSNRPEKPRRDLKNSGHKANRFNLLHGGFYFEGKSKFGPIWIILVSVSTTRLKDAKLQ